MSDKISSFVDQYLPTAQSVAERTGVDPHILLAQWGVETGWGNSVVPGTNNLGNIKGGNTPAKDNQTGSIDNYRSYPSHDAFADDFSNLIASKYPNAMHAGPDANAYASGISGYAQDPNYAKKIVDATDTVRKSQGAYFNPTKIKWDSPDSSNSNSPDIDEKVDLSKVKWDVPGQTATSSTSEATSKGIDLSKVKWDQPEQPAAPSSIHVKPTVASSPSSDSLSGVWANAKAGALGELKGAFDTVVEGPAQLMANAAADAYPKGWPGHDFLESQRQVANQGQKDRQTEFENATAGHEMAAGIGKAAGEIDAALGLPIGKAEETNFVGRMINAAKTGGVLGAAQPVNNSSSPVDYWWNKGKQVISGAMGGAAGQSVGEIGGKMIGGVANTVTNYVRPLISKLSADGNVVLPEALNSASPELQNSVRHSLAKGEQIDPKALHRQLEADALPVKMSLTAGQAKQDPIAISNEMNLRGKNPAMVYKLNDQNNQLIQNLDQIRDSSAPEAIAPDHITAGETLISSAKKILADQDAKTSELYKQLEQANGGALPMNGQDFAIQANQALGKSMKAPFLPGQVQSIITDLQTGKHPMTFENFENLRTILASEARKADRAGDGNAMAAINTVRNTLENMPMSNEAGNVKQLADAARASAKQGFDMLRANPALAAIDSGKAVADNFIQKFIVNGNKTDLMSLATAYKDDPVALQTMKAGVVNYLRNQAVGQSGNFSQGAYNKALQAMGPKLDIMFSPEEAQTLRTLGNVARYTQIQPKGAYVNNSNTDVANLARTGGNLAAHAVDAATHSPAGSIINNVVGGAVERKLNAKEMGKALNPGAGVGGVSPASRFMTQALPSFTGRSAVPLSSMLFINSVDSDKKQPNQRK